MTHLEAFEQKTGRRHPLLADGPVLPPECASLWSDFLDLHSSRQAGQSGPARISFIDLDAWQRVTGAKLDAWEIDAIRGADSAFMASLK